MIIAEDVTATVDVARSAFEADKEAYFNQAMDALQERIIALGGRPFGLDFAVETEPLSDAARGDRVHVRARVTGMDKAEIVGGHHDGYIVTVDPHAPAIRIPMERGVDLSAVTLTKENARRYERVGVNDATGHWAFAPIDWDAPV